MADTVRIVDYYYTTVADKPGEGGRLLGILRDARVNLLAFSGFPSQRKAQVDFVPADAASFVAAAKAAKVKLKGPKKAFLIDGDDRTGAIAGVLAKLGAAKVNATAVDAVCAGMGRYGAILWVKPKDLKKAAAALGVMMM
ncbi:MAG TPA: hypothetical protein VGQ06_08205 [Gemmatimonadales bacterium]|jgi:hypothetical protein|nr:hypothetical protein [Gemmatimonadales bacterium]